MSDYLRPSQADDASDLADRTDHPLAAGGLAVSFVVLLVLTARVVAGNGGEGDGNCWMLVGAACSAALGWAIVRRIPSMRTGHFGFVPPWTGGPAERGTRRHRRYVPANRTTALLIGDGRRMSARIANISVAAVAIEAKMSDMEFASVFRVGSREVDPVRRTATGAVFRFKSLLDPQQFDENFVL